MKYIIDMSDEYVMESALYGKQLAIPFYVNANDKSFFLPTGLKVEPYVEPDRKVIEDAQEEAWEFAKQVTIMTPDDKCELWGTSKYNTINFGYSYAEAKAKYEEWKKQKDEIHVGDEVEYECGGLNRFVVTGIYGRYAVGFKDEDDDIDVGDYCDIKYLRKTGRHFSDIEKLLKKMRGEV